MIENGNGKSDRNPGFSGFQLGKVVDLGKCPSHVWSPRIGKTFTSCRCRSTAVKTTVKTLGVEPISSSSSSSSSSMIVIISVRRRISIIIAIPSTIQIFQILASLYAAKAVLTLTTLFDELWFDPLVKSPHAWCRTKVTGACMTTVLEAPYPNWCSC